MRYLATVIAAALLTALSGCSSPPREKIIYQTVPVVLTVSCIPSELPEEPEGLLTPRSVLLLSGPLALSALAADWLVQRQRRIELETVVRACREAQETKEAPAS